MKEDGILRWMQKYRFGFDGWGLVLFVGIMVPNLIWFALPAPKDILREESATGGLDTVASICQVLLAAALVGVVKRERKERISVWAAAACLGYYAAWAAYYLGATGPGVIAALSVLPCAALLAFELERKNYVALGPTAVFTVCHTLSSVVNFRSCIHRR